MSTDIPTLPAPRGFFDPIRHNMMKTLGVDQSSTIKTRGLPVVVYIDRQVRLAVLGIALWLKLYS
jgi:hypothetical protein